jgi:nucleoside 2-deoxyribosyltransferase
MAVKRKRKLRVYLAGPEVFLPDAVEIGIRKKALCADYGFEGLFPFDNEVPPGPGMDRVIYAANVAMMRRADCGILNLTPFRGVSADVGTVFELGLLTGFRKPSFGYTNEKPDLLRRMRQRRSATFDRATKRWRDVSGMEIEHFGNVDNLMIDACFAAQGREIVRNRTSDANRFRDLRGFELCLGAARAFFEQADASRTRKAA